MPRKKQTNARMTPVPKYKLVFVGDESVGKTSIITRFVNGEFEDNYEATIGVDFLTKRAYKDNDYVVKLQLWDTAGQERFRSLIPSYIRNTHCICFVYDMTNSESFENIDFWFKKTSEFCSNIDNLHLVLIGNKQDCDDKRVVTFEDAKSKANELKFDDVFEVSAKTGFNIDDLFKDIVDDLPEIENKITARVDVELEDEVNMDTKEKSGCC